jgi:hypothetical protein
MKANDRWGSWGGGWIAEWLWIGPTKKVGAHLHVHIPSQAPHRELCQGKWAAPTWLLNPPSSGPCDKEPGQVSKKSPQCQWFSGLEALSLWFSHFLLHWWAQLCLGVHLSHFHQNERVGLHPCGLPSPFVLSCRNAQRQGSRDDPYPTPGSVQAAPGFSLGLVFQLALCASAETCAWAGQQSGWHRKSVIGEVYRRAHILEPVL